MAEDSPSMVAYLQGGESTVTNTSEGVMVIHIPDTIPYFYVPTGNLSRLMPVNQIPELHIH